MTSSELLSLGTFRVYHASTQTRTNSRDVKTFLFLLNLWHTIFSFPTRKVQRTIQQPPKCRTWPRFLSTLRCCKRSLKEWSRNRDQFQHAALNLSSFQKPEKSQISLHSSWVPDENENSVRLSETSAITRQRECPYCFRSAEQPGPFYNFCEGVFGKNFYRWWTCWSNLSCKMKNFSK